jgi:hypothetical protein
MLTKQKVDRYGLVSVLVMMLLLVLLWTEAVPSSMRLPLLLVAIALFMVRVTMRLILARQQRQAGSKGEPPAPGPTAGGN